MKSYVIALLGLTLVHAGCARSQNAEGSIPSAVASNKTTSAISRIVFVGKAEACDCTRKSIDASWTALQSALATRKPLPVEKLEVDVDEVKVEPYRKQKAVVALPGIYLVDDKGTVVELLQGELSEGEIAAKLPLS